MGRLDQEQLKAPRRSHGHLQTPVGVAAVGRSSREPSREQCAAQQ
jgi:hypothetical protein